MNNKIPRDQTRQPPSSFPHSISSPFSNSPSPSLLYKKEKPNKFTLTLKSITTYTNKIAYPAKRVILTPRIPILQAGEDQLEKRRLKWSTVTSLNLNREDSDSLLRAETSSLNFFTVNSELISPNWSSVSGSSCNQGRNNDTSRRWMASWKNITVVVFS